MRTAFSAISSGTEKAAVEAGRKSLLGKAMARPDLVKQVLEYAQSNGIAAARQKVQARLETLSALGYSCSGFVLEAGAGATGFQPGDRVACAGVGYASHGEINFVPANLAVLVPGECKLAGCLPDDHRRDRYAGCPPGKRHLRGNRGRDRRRVGGRSGDPDIARGRLPGHRHRSFRRTRGAGDRFWRASRARDQRSEPRRRRRLPSHATAWMRR